MTTRAGRGLRWGVALAGLPPALALFALAHFRPPDGREHGDLAQFFGRFHPTIVHFPVALLALVLVLEAAGATRRWARLRESAGFVLGLATLGAFAAAFLGWLLAWSGGYRGPVVTLHLRSGAWLCLAAVLCCALRRRPPGPPGLPYGLALTATVALMVWTGHLGGRLSHGDTFLTEYMPVRARAWFGLSSSTPRRGVTAGGAVPVPASGGADSFYRLSIAPILDAHCVVCHDANKQKGKLRLDSYAWIMHGGEDGPVIKPGDPAGSDLYRRITLPPDDDDFMPSDGKPPLPPDAVRLIEHWIATGASATLSDHFVPVGVAAPAAPPPAAPDYRPFLPQLAALEVALGLRLVPRSQVPTDGIILRTVSAPGRCDDAALARLAPVAALIVDAELARTKVTDAGVKILAGFPNLRSLDLSYTAVTSAQLGRLAALPHLYKLNLTATAIDAAGLAQLRRARGLRQIYYFQTKAFSH